MLKFRAPVLVCLLMCGVLVQNVLAGGFNYRYKDDAGNMHIGYSIPPEFVDNGYELLNDQGVVVDVILPKSVTDAQASEKLKELEAQHQRELQASKDETLLRYYSSPEDVERVRERKLGEFQTFIEIQKANTLVNRRRLTKLQHQAAEMELNGQQVPEKILTTLDTLEHKISDSKQAIDLKQEEKNRVWLAFELDIERLKGLLGVNDTKSEEQASASGNAKETVIQ